MASSPTGSDSYSETLLPLPTLSDSNSIFFDSEADTLLPDDDIPASGQNVDHIFLTEPEEIPQEFLSATPAPHVTVAASPPGLSFDWDAELTDYATNWPIPPIPSIGTYLPEIDGLTLLPSGVLPAEHIDPASLLSSTPNFDIADGTQTNQPRLPRIVFPTVIDLPALPALPTTPDWMRDGYNPYMDAHFGTDDALDNLATYPDNWPMLAATVDPVYALCGALNEVEPDELSGAPLQQVGEVESDIESEDDDDMDAVPSSANQQAKRGKRPAQPKPASGNASTTTRTLKRDDPVHVARMKERRNERARLLRDMQREAEGRAWRDPKPKTPEHEVKLAHRRVRDQAIRDKKKAAKVEATRASLAQAAGRPAPSTRKSAKQNADKRKLRPLLPKTPFSSTASSVDPLARTIPTFSNHRVWNGQGAVTRSVARTMAKDEEDEESDAN